MDESALRTLLNSLEASRSSLHVLLHGFIWAVVVGLGLDLIVIIKEFWDDWKEFRYSQVHPCELHLPKRPSVGLLVLGLLGTALIVIGVSGELYVDVQAGNIETQIRDTNDKLLGLIIQEAGNAKASAEGAASAASRAKTSADAAGEAAREAQRKVGAVAKQAGQLRADLEYVQSEAIPRWRTMTLRGRWKALADELKGKPVSQFEILYPSEDEEAFTFAQLLEKMLQAAGWTSLGIRPLKESDALEGKWGDIPGAPLAVRAGAMHGMALISKTGVPNPQWEYVKKSAIAALMVGFGAGQGIPDPRMPDNVIRIIIGQEQGGN